MGSPSPSSNESDRVADPVDAAAELSRDSQPDAEWARIVRLRVVRHLTSIIRRWYRVEIAFSDSSGYVRAFEGNRIFEPTNAVCRLVLNTREGFRNCIASSREAHDVVRRIRK